jgi:hypothetical protein
MMVKKCAVCPKPQPDPMSSWAYQCPFYALPGPHRETPIQGVDKLQHTSILVVVTVIEERAVTSSFPRK